eukprot:m.147747 g.147747  ORF g.147747 m.147747 type:complete len:917 (+) comp16829_c2_seq1:104-2854(+)
MASKDRASAPPVSSRPVGESPRRRETTSALPAGAAGAAGAGAAGATASASTAGAGPGAQPHHHPRSASAASLPAGHVTQPPASAAASAAATAAQEEAASVHSHESGGGSHPAGAGGRARPDSNSEMAGGESTDDEVGEDGKPKRQRRRGMLKLFYGTTTGQAGVRSNPLDLDSNTFRPNEYVDRMLRQCNLHELIRHDSQLSSQIKALDSDMQTLVYENYNKFISATDTIRKMKGQVENMDDAMTSLHSKMQAIAKTSAKIDETLAPKRNQILKLSSSHSLLKKLQFLFELPSRLKMCVDKQAYTQAVKYYAKASGILNKYKHMDSFRSIHNECNEIVAQLQQKLMSQAEAQPTATEQLVDAIKLLASLSTDFSKLHDFVLKKAADQWAIDTRQQAEILNTDAAELPKKTEEFVAFGNRNVLFHLADWILAFQDIFIGDQNSADGGPDTPTQASAKEQIYVPAPAAIPAAQKRLKAFVDDLVSQYIASAGKAVTKAVEAGIPSTQYVSCVSQLYSGLMKIHTVVPDAGIGKRAGDCIVQQTKQMVRFIGTKLNEKGQSALQRALSQVMTGGGTRSTNLNVADMVSSTQQYLVDTCEGVLKELRAVMSTELLSCHKYFGHEFPVRTVRVGLLQGFLSSISNTAMLYIGPTATEGDHQIIVPAKFRLFLSSLCASFAAVHVPGLIAMAAQLYPVDDSHESDQFAIEQQKEMFIHASQCLVSYFVIGQGRAIANMIIAAVGDTDWLACQPPSAPSPYVQSFISSVESADAMLNYLKNEGNANVVSPLPGSRELQAKIAQTTRKLFSERVEIFTSSSPTKRSVLIGIIKIVLKALSESLRRTTLGVNALRQFHVDCQAIHLFLHRYIDSETTDRIFATLMGQVGNSAAQRCIEIVDMDFEAIDRICGEQVGLSQPSSTEA